MNRKFLGIKISTYMTVVFCAIIAVFCWLYVKYVEPMESVAAFGCSLWI